MDPVKMHKETVEIEGGRNLYNYTFEIEGEETVEDKDEGEVERETEC
jgi:hypothetical protein